MARFFFILLLLAIGSCNFSDNLTENFSSPKTLFVDHIRSYTGGVISVGSDIRLKLTNSVSDSLADFSLDDIFQFSPDIQGSTHWEDQRTLVFTPANHLPHGQKYEAEVDMESLIPDIDPEKSQFRFEFQTLTQNFELSIGGFKLYDSKDLSKLKLEGSLQTADLVDFAQLKKVISATQSEKSLTVNWGAVKDDHSVNFTVEQIQRKDQAETVVLEVDGEAILVDKTLEHEVEVPALGDYKVISSRVVRGAENYISVLFSDPLDARQNLVGMVTLSNTNNRHRTVVDLNELKIYPTQELSSETELVVNTGIKNTAGYPLKESYRTVLQFAQAKPEVRLPDGQKATILPNSSELFLPFEAVGLKAVDVTVVRIFEDNMLQYLQVNDLGGQSELNRVSKPVARKTIPLNTSGVTNLNTWNRFTLSLEEVFQAEPGAYYQMHIGFKRQHSLYFCANSDQLESLGDKLEELDPTEEESYWDNYEYYYNPNYNWEERDNPCSESYYGRRRSVSKMLMASSLGVIAKRRDGGNLSIFVSNLMSAETEEDVSVEVYDFQQRLIGSGATDSDGFARIEVTNAPFALVAKKKGQTAYLKLNAGSALSLSNFDVSGKVIQKGLKGFIYGERGVWRPGDTLHLAFVLEDIEKNLPEKHPVVMELYNPAGQLSYRKVSSEGVHGMYRFDFSAEKDAPTGNWRAKAKVGGVTFQKTLKIETIKPNRLKIDLQLDKDKFTAADQSVSGDLKVKWLTGANAGGLKAEYELSLKPIATTFKGYPNFSFDDQAKEYASSRELVFEGKLNESGFKKVNINLGKTDEAPGAMMANLYGKVYEEGGDFSISHTAIPYYPYTSFVGVKTPEGDKRGMLLTDKDHTVRIASVDANGNPISRSGVKVELFKLNWKWWWDNSYEHISNYVGRSYHEPIAQGKVNTSNGEGKWTLRINHPEWGRYYLRVTDPTSGHTAGKVVYLDWPGWAGKGKRGELDGASMLDFSVEKEEYQIGEQITMSIPSTAGNKMLVSLETGSEILQTFWVDTEEGNTTLSFEATADMAPNIYTHLTMVQPHGQTANDLPIRLYGVKSIKVVDPATELKPLITLPQELRPEQTFEVQVSEASGKAMAYTLAMVDEGLLDITNYKTPQPWENFYAREALGIKTWDIYDDVMGAFTGKIDYLLAIGGDGEIKPRDENEANRFKPVVKYLGPFYLEKGEKKTHTLRMPQYVGSVKTMVVAAANGAYGSADAVTPVKQPMMVLATLPRVTGPGELIKLPVNVFATEDRVGEVKVTVEASGMLALEGAKSLKTQLNKAGDEVLYFDLQAKPALGTGKVKVTAQSAKFRATYDVEMNVIPRNPSVTHITDTVLASNATWSHSYKPLGLLGENRASLEISTMPPLNLEQRLNYLIRYPHGCIEQTTSAVFAQLYLNRLTDLSEDRKQAVQRNVEAAIQRLNSFQVSSGGFSYWPGHTYPNNWGSNYAGHFLVEAQSAGYAVPEGMLSRWVSYQTGKAESWNSLSSDEDDDLVQAYRLYTLALAGNPALGAMNRMKEKSDIQLEAKWRLASAYAAAGYQDQSQKLINGLSHQVDSQTQYHRASFGSSIRNQAMILETLIALKKSQTAFEILMDIAGKMGDKDHWMSTQTTAYCFIALATYADVFDLEKETDVELMLEGNKVPVNNQNFINTLSLNQPDEESKVNVRNYGDAPVFVRVISTGIPLEGEEQSLERNIRLNIAYEDMNARPVDVSRLPSGTNFKAVVTVTNLGLRGDFHELALTQLFPSGWEIINTRLNDTGQNQQNADYLDIRDDRVMH
ncbi:MAG: alpha-2-macroglobulin [Cyclobacteriaceae bacterium]